MKRNLLGLVLCGGESGRMGDDKARLEVRRGVSQIDYITGLLGKFCDRVAVSTGPKDRGKGALPQGVEALADVEFVDGPMAGVIAGLRSAGPCGVLVAAVDMPYLEASRILQLVNRRNEEKRATAFVAEDGQPEPMCTIYEASCLDEMERLGRAGKASLRRFLIDADTELIALARSDWLASVNDPTALKRAREELS